MEGILKNQERSQRILILFLSFSVLGHLIFSFVHINSNISSFKNTSTIDQKIVIKLLQDRSKKKQVVQTEKSVDKKVNDSKFLSEENSFFDRETKASSIGKFKTAGLGDPKSINKKMLEKEEVKSNKQFENLQFSDLSLKSNEVYKIEKKAKQKVSMQKKGIKSGVDKSFGLGKSSDHLEDIPLGDFTKLNAQEFQYYGFYHRIRQKLEQFWGMNIQEKAKSISKQGRSIASGSNLVTGVMIDLNNKGEITSIMLKSTSGIKELDDAAIEAFNQAGPFPNPPKGMVKNGRARIDWGFVVNT